MTEEKGRIHLYTGDGKGKTTAALGLALRAVGQGMKVAFVQFMKGWEYGEVKAIKHLPGFTLEQFGRRDFVDPEKPDPADTELAQIALARAEEFLHSGEYDLVVMDEAIVAVNYGLLPWADLLRVLDGKPPRLELVLTGRRATPEMIARADLATEMQEIKHYYSSEGVSARRGIEF